MSKFMQFGDIINSSAKTGVEIDFIPKGVYRVNLNETFGWHLVKDTLGSLPEKMYGEIFERADMIINTFMSRSKRGVNTGAMFSGDKGSGKTLLAKYVSHLLAEKQGIPTIIVDSSFGSNTGAMCNFLSKIEQPVIILFDEFDKRFNDRDSQEAMLTLIDGMGNANKLFLFTRNSGYLSEFFVNRPSRVWYSFSYDKITMASMIGYLEDNLNNEKHIESFKNLHDVAALLSFDIVQSITEELNRYPNMSFGQCIDNMGISMSDVRYIIKSFAYKGKEQNLRHKTTVSISDFISGEEYISVYPERSSGGEGNWTNGDLNINNNTKGIDIKFEGDTVYVENEHENYCIVLQRERVNTYLSHWMS